MDLALTADLGNTRLKLCVWSLEGGATVVARAVFDTQAGLARAASDFARAHPGIRVGALSSVASASLETELLRELSRAVDVPIRAAPEPGLGVAVREPARVGRDRLYAARGALEIEPVGDLVVVDAGTALTVDALEARARRFLGGAIAPGPVLLARALAEHTARLPLVEVSPGSAALGRDTESAVRAGVVVGFRGAARELALSVASEAGFDHVAVVVTGGARGFLLDPPVFEPPRFPRVVVDEDLVHRGLLAALLAAPGR